MVTFIGQWRQTDNTEWTEDTWRAAVRSANEKKHRAAWMLYIGAQVGYLKTPFITEMIGAQVCISAYYTWDTGRHFTGPPRVDTSQEERLRCDVTANNSQVKSTFNDRIVHLTDIRTSHSWHSPHDTAKYTCSIISLNTELTSSLIV